MPDVNTASTAPRYSKLIDTLGYYVCCFSAGAVIGMAIQAYGWFAVVWVANVMIWGTIWRIQTARKRRLAP